MDGTLLIELVSIAFVSGGFVTALRSNQRSLAATQKEQSTRFDRLEKKVDHIHEKFDRLPCRTGACNERV